MTRRAVVVVALALAGRIAVAMLAPASDDLLAWRQVGEVLARGGDAYSGGRLNWPPLWMLWIGAAQGVAGLGLPFDAVVRFLPFAADVAIVLVLHRLSPGAALAFALHPVALVVVGAQAQFDTLPALATLLAVVLAGSGEKRSQVLAGVAIGVGAGFKTWPLFVLPALLAAASGWAARRRLALPAVLIPAALLLPVALATPDAFRTHVVGYRSSPGWWGLTALGVLFPGTATAAVAQAASEHVRALVLTGIALSVVIVRARRLRPDEAALVALLAFYALTPGFGPQYLVWIVPLGLLAGGPLPLTWNLVASAAVVTECLLPRISVSADMGSAARQLLGNYEINLLRLPVWVAGIGWLAGLATGLTSTPKLLPSCDADLRGPGRTTANALPGFHVQTERRWRSDDVLPGAGGAKAVAEIGRRPVSGGRRRRRGPTTGCGCSRTRRRRRRA